MRATAGPADLCPRSAPHLRTSANLVTCGWIGCGSPTSGRTTSAELALAPGLTALLGDNGQGKTNVLEAIAWLATLASFRGAPTEALIRQGAERAVVRAEGEREGRAILIEAELVASGRNRVLVNRQPLKRAPRPARRAARHGVRARRPRAGEGRPGRAPALPRRRAGGVAPALRRPARRRSTRSSSSATPCSRGPAAASTRAPPSPSTCGTPSSSRPAGGWPRPARRLLDRLAPVLSQTYDAVANRPAEVTATYVAAWAADGPRGGAGGVPEGRRAAGRVDGRAAPRRRRPAPRRPPEPHPRLAGRAAVAGPGAAARRPPRGHRRHRQRPRPAARRRVLRARPRPQRRPPRQPARRARPSSRAPAACPPRPSPTSSSTSATAASPPADGHRARRGPAAATVRHGSPVAGVCVGRPPCWRPAQRRPDA